jgi:MFS family permease
MASEIVPKEQMGRWFGLIGLTRGLVSVPAPLLAGLIWEHAGPRYVFIFAVLLDAAFRLPLLASIRETLDSGFFHKPRGKNAGSAVSAVSPYSPSGHPPGESSGPGWGDSCKMQ